MQRCLTLLLFFFCSGCICAPKPKPTATASEIQERVFHLAPLPASAKVLACRSLSVANDRRQRLFYYPYGAYIEACSFEIAPEQFVDVVPRGHYSSRDAQVPGDAGQLVRELIEELPAPIAWHLRSERNLQLILADSSHRYGVIMTTHCRCGRPDQ